MRHAITKVGPIEGAADLKREVDLIRQAADYTGLSPKTHAWVPLDLLDRLSAALGPPDDRCRYCDGRTFYIGKDVKTGQEVEISCLYCNETGKTPPAIFDGPPNLAEAGVPIPIVGDAAVPLEDRYGAADAEFPGSVDMGRGCEP